MDKSKVGKTGEWLASKYLSEHHYVIIDRNYRMTFGEIDIVALDPDGTLVFCEVKSLLRDGLTCGGFMPEDNLTPAKYKKMVRMANFFSLKFQELVRGDRGWRLDLIAVTLSEGGEDASIAHYENI
jgi:putative endonuclease